MCMQSNEFDSESNAQSLLIAQTVAINELLADCDSWWNHIFNDICAIDVFKTNSIDLLEGDDDDYKEYRTINIASVTDIASKCDR